MKDWEITNAQQAVNIVAAVMAGQPRQAVEVELRDWLDRRGATLPEPMRSRVVDAVALGATIVTLRVARQGGQSLDPAVDVIAYGTDAELAPRIAG